MRILVAEDETIVADSLSNGIIQSGFTVDVAYNGEDAWFLGSTENYAAIVLDLGLPKIDGLTILRRWRAEGIATPVIILSARGSWAERVEGIDSGADDYLPKPFQIQELVSRLKALVRRASGHAQSTLNIGPLQLDLRNNQTTVNGNFVQLTPLEFRLLHCLVLNSDRVVSAIDLADNLYNLHHERDVNAVEAIVSRLRRKLGNGIIQNKRGFGYFIASAATAPT
jgi:two-component system, OmpR family, response regulator